MPDKDNNVIISMFDPKTGQTFNANGKEAEMYAKRGMVERSTVRETGMFPSEGTLDKGWDRPDMANIYENLPQGLQGAEVLPDAEPDNRTTRVFDPFHAADIISPAAKATEISYKTNTERVDVIDPDGQIQSIPKDNVAKAIGLGYKVTGTITTPQLPVIPVGTTTAPGKTVVLDPEGNLQSIDTAKLDQAKQMGYKTQSDAASDSVVNILKSKYGDTGVELLNMVHSGLNSLVYGEGDKALSNITNLVTPHLGADNIKILEEKYGIPQDQLGQTIVNAFHKIANESPISSTIGGVGGAVIPMLATGGAGVLGEGALAGKAAAGVKALVGTSSFGVRMLGSALGEAAGGAVLMTPQILAQGIINKDPVAAGETLAWGALTGGGLGTLMQGAREATVGIKAGIEGLQDIINNKNSTLNSIVGNEENVAKVPLSAAEREDAINKIAANGGEGKIPDTKEVVTPTYLTDKLLGDALGMSPTARSKFGSTIAQQHEKLGELIDYIGKDEISKMNNKEFAQSIIDANNETGPKIGRLINMLDNVSTKQKDIIMRPSVFTQKIALENLAKGFEGEPMFAAERKVIKTAIDQLDAVAGKDSVLSFKDQQDYKKLLQSKVKYNVADSSSLNDTKKQVAAIARQEMDDAGDRISQLSGNPEIVDAWIKQKKMFGLTNSLYDHAEKVINGKESKSLDFGHLMGAVGGHMIGSALGVPGLGTLIGAVGQKIGSQWIRENAPTKIASFLRKNEMNPNFPTYIVLDAAKILDSKIKEIPKILRSPVIPIVASNAIKNSLGEESNGLSKQQQFERHANQLNNMVSNTDVLKSQISSMSMPIIHYHPEVGQAMDNALMTRIQYLHDNLPKQMSEPEAFSKDKPFVPSLQQINDYSKILAVAEDPFHVIQELKNGTLTAKQVEAMSVLNPAILSKIRDKIMEEAYSGGDTGLDYQQKLGAAMLMGQDLGTGWKNVQQYQSMYGPASPAQQMGAGPPPKQHGKGGSKLNVDKMPGAQYTQSQRLSK